MTENRPESRGGLGTVRNAVILLELLAQGPGFRALTDLAEQSGLSLPTTHRLLRSLALADFVSQDPRSSRYGLGPELTHLSHRYLARLPAVAALEPYLGAFGHLVALRDGDLAYLHVHPHGDAPEAGETSGPEIVFEATAPTPGRYLLFLDFQIDGQVHTAPLVLDTTGEASPDGGSHEGAGGHEEGGYHEH